MDARPATAKGDPMKIYIVIIEDRHVDVEVEPFSTAELAIEYAKEARGANCRHPEDIEEGEITQDMRDEGWLYHSTYSSEGDSVRVVERTLDYEEDGDDEETPP